MFPIQLNGKIIKLQINEPTYKMRAIWSFLWQASNSAVSWYFIINKHEKLVVNTLSSRSLRNSNTGLWEASPHFLPATCKHCESNDGVCTWWFKFYLLSLSLLWLFYADIFTLACIWWCLLLQVHALSLYVLFSLYCIRFHLKRTFLNCAKTKWKKE